MECSLCDSTRQLILQVCLFTSKDDNVLLCLQAAHGLLAVNARGALSFRVKLMLSKGGNKVRAASVLSLLIRMYIGVYM